MSDSDVHLIQGRRVTMPVEIRKASVATAMFAVPAATAQEIIDYSGLEVAEPLPGRAICTLTFIDYVDGDLDSYHEFGVVFLVRGHEAGPKPHGAVGRLRDARNVGAFIHQLPVDQAFTLEAGRSIWGFPKVMADIPVQMSSRIKRAALRFDGRTVVELAIRPGLPLPTPMPRSGAGAGNGADGDSDGTGAPAVSAYSCLDGVTRHIPWVMEPSGVRSRLGGATVRLGDHPMADDLRRLGLDGARALATSTIRQVGMTFGPATDVGR